MDQVLLRLLPVKNPRELVQLDGPGPFSGRTMNDRTFSYPMYVDLRDRNDVFAGLVARFGASATLTQRNQAERVDVELVSGNTFEVLGVSPGHRPRADARRRSHAGRASGGPPQLRLLAAPLRRARPRSSTRWSPSTAPP